MENKQQINCRVENYAHNKNGQKCSLNAITVASMSSDDQNINHSICASFDTK